MPPAAHNLHWTSLILLLTLVREVSRDANAISQIDRRRRVFRVLAEYRDSEGDVYRKPFEAKDAWPGVPLYGTHSQLHAKRQQW
jgi:hypothetical protein